MQNKRKTPQNAVWSALEVIQLSSDLTVYTFMDESYKPLRSSLATLNFPKEFSPENLVAILICGWDF